MQASAFRALWEDTENRWADSKLKRELNKARVHATMLRLLLGGEGSSSE